MSIRNQASGGRTRIDERLIHSTHPTSRMTTRLLGRFGAIVVIMVATAFVTAPPLKAQEDSARSLMGSELLHTRRTSVNVYPFAYYNPELKLAFGAGGIIAFYTSKEAILRPSKISISGYYSTSGQYSVSVAPQIYLQRNLLFISGKVHYGDRTYYTPLESNPELKATSYGASAEVRLAEAPKTMNALRLTDLKQWALVIDYEHVSFQDEPGFDNLPPNNLGFGLARVWDSRDNIFYPMRGRLIRIEALFYSRALGSSFDMNHYETDFRWYESVNARRRQVVALQVHCEYLGGHPPLYQLPALGNSNLMRGYKSGTMRDQLYVAGQAEFRTHLWWRLGAVAFVGAGDVGSYFTDLTWKRIKPSYGGGLRFLFNKEEGINLRVDLGFGDETDGIYFGIEEAF